MQVKYDYLTNPIDQMQLQAFAQQSPSVKVTKYYPFFGAVFSGFMGMFLIIPFFGAIAAMMKLGVGGSWGFIALGEIGLIAAGYFLGQFLKTRAVEHLYRLTSFTQANGWSYNARLSNPSHAGMIFDIGHSRIAQDQIYSTDGNLFEIANYSYTTGSGKNSHTYNWGYICIKLKRRVPNMVLDSKANNSNLLGLTISNLPESLRGNATMSLEGDFNKYFTLYAPKEYERDALYVFTPELMAVLVDESAKFDVEVVDDRMYVYSSTPFDLTKVATLQAIFKIVNQVGEEMIDNTDYYADERVGDRSANIVAAGGARLKHKVPIFVIVIFVIVILFQFLPQLLSLFIHIN